MSTLVGIKGQVTIEKEIRDALGVEPGWRAIQRLDGERVVIEFRRPKHRRSLAGVLAGKAKRTFSTPEDLEAAIEEAWTAAAQDPASGDREE
jgi:bifunctional DNA-binding transcriptional regulator/antitoxin component of YhaV-PrlF toxin-antitoxin module